MSIPYKKKLYKKSAQRDLRNGVIFYVSNFFIVKRKNKNFLIEKIKIESLVINIFLLTGHFEPKISHLFLDLDKLSFNSCSSK